MANAGSTASSKQWDIHEHVAASVEIEAKKLLEAAGNREIAKQALDGVADANPTSEEQQEIFAESLGFQSYRSLVETSTPVQPTADRQWYVTSLRPNQWALWNDRDIEVTGIFESPEDASKAAS